MQALDNLTKCGFCKKTLNDSLLLLCHHSFCRQCLVVNTQNAKVTCATCKQTFPVPNNNIDNTFKPSFLAGYFFKLNKNYYESIQITDEEKAEMEGLCECTPLPKPVKKEEGKPAPPDPVKLKLSICFHCSKNLCEKCRKKHYTEFKEKPLKSLEDFQEGSANLMTTVEKLNEARALKIKEYQSKKTEINKTKLDLAKRLDDEEKSLIDQLNTECELENVKIKNTIDELRHIELIKEAGKQVRRTILDLTFKLKRLSENNPKQLVENLNDFNKAQEEWKRQLQLAATRADPKLETKLIFEQAKNKDNLIGTFDSKKGKFKDIKQAKIPDKNKSSVCTVL